MMDEFREMLYKQDLIISTSVKKVLQILIGDTASDRWIRNASLRD